MSLRSLRSLLALQMVMQMTQSLTTAQVTAPAITSVAAPAIPAAPAAPVIVSTSVQQSPTPLPKGLQLVAITICSAAPRPMVTAPQIFNALQQVGIGYQAPSLYPGLISRSVSRTPVSLLLSTVKYTATGVSIGSGIEGFLKSQDANVSNSATYQKISIIAGVAGVTMAIVQPVLQGDVNTQQATITAGVQAALMTEADNYSIAAGIPCATNPHLMLYAAGAVGAQKAVIP
jgi:hypothetical protein